MAVAATEPAQRRNGVQLIARAASVLRALADHRAGLRLSELAEAVELPKSTVHRIVQALEVEDLVTSASAGKVRVGPGLARLGAASRGALRDELHPTLRQLSQELGETVDLAILEGDNLRFIDQVAAPQRLRAVSAVGATFPLHCTANGKALLAKLPRDEAAALLPSRLRAFTPMTITSRKRLWEELDEVAATGIAYDREEHTEGISAVGAVVGDAFGTMAAVSVPMPTQRFAGREAEVASRLREVCAEATRALGGDPAY